MAAIIIGYILAYICLKISSLLDKKYKLLNDSTSSYAQWLETHQGRNKIATIIFLIPFINGFIYQKTNFKIF